MPQRIAYMALNTYPEATPDPAILAAVSFAARLGYGLHVTTFAVAIPPVVSPISGFLINVEGMVRAAEDRSNAECERLKALVEGAAGPGLDARVESHRLVPGGAPDAAAAEARYFDLAVLPWAAGNVMAQDMAQAVVFGAGVPVILVPSSAPAGPVDHIAVAWDDSRVAARALCDALPLLSISGRISVLTVQDEKSLVGSGIAQTLVAALERRGYTAEAVELTLASRTVATVLQDTALARGAQLLAMGGFGHSRLRDFILGGATKGVLGDLRIPTLMAH